MKQYELVNILGTSYRHGNIVSATWDEEDFIDIDDPISNGSNHNNGRRQQRSKLFVPMGHRVVMYELALGSHSAAPSTTTLPFALNEEVHVLAVDNKGVLLVAIDGAGQGLLFNTLSKTVLAHFNFLARSDTESEHPGDQQENTVASYGRKRALVQAAAFSPDASRLAVAAGLTVTVWYTPAAAAEHREFAPFHLDRRWRAGNALHTQDVLFVSWSPCGRFLLTGSADMAARVVYVGEADPVKDEDDPAKNTFVDAGIRTKPTALLAHKHHVIGGGFFALNTTDISKKRAPSGSDDYLGIVTVGRDAVVYFWTLDCARGKLLPAAHTEPPRSQPLYGKMQRLFLSTHVEDRTGQNQDTDPQQSNAFTSVGHVSSVNLAWPNRLLCGFQSGAFALYDLLGTGPGSLSPTDQSASATLFMGELALVQALSLGSGKVGACAFMGLHLAFAMPPSIKLDTKQPQTDLDPRYHYEDEESLPSRVCIWDWRAEAFVMRISGHLVAGVQDGSGPWQDAHLTACVLDESLTGSTLVLTGDSAGAVKAWDGQSGACLATLANDLPSQDAISQGPSGAARDIPLLLHRGSIVGLHVIRSRKVLLSAGADGVVRAVDLRRFKVFRELVAPPLPNLNDAKTSPTYKSCPNTNPRQALMEAKKPQDKNSHAPSSLQAMTPQLSGGVVADVAGDLVMAGTWDGRILVWSLQTGALVDTWFASGTGPGVPVSSLAYDALHDRIAAGTWDGSVRVWHLGSSSSSSSIPLHFQHDCEVMALAFHPSGNELACTTLSGSIHVWSVAPGDDEVRLACVIEAHGDVWLPATSSESKFSAREGVTQLALRSKITFGALAYTADGSGLLVGGRASPWILLYDVESRVLLDRFAICRGRHLRSSSLDSHAGGVVLKRGKVALKPGAAPAEALLDAYDCHALAVAPTGRQWCAVTGEGCLVFAWNDALVTFDPFDLDLECTPQAIAQAVQGADWLRALVLGLRLGDGPFLAAYVYAQMPLALLDGVIRDVPVKYLPRLLTFTSRIVLNRNARECVKMTLFTAKVENAENEGNKLDASMIPLWADLERTVSWCQAILHRHFTRPSLGLAVVISAGQVSNVVEPSLRVIHQALADFKADYNRLVLEDVTLLDDLVDSFPGPAFLSYQ